MLQCVAVCCSVLQSVAVCCSVLQCVAVCCSVLQCVAVCSSMLQCVPQTKGGATISRLLKMMFSFAEYSLFYWALLQKRRIILRSLLIVALD